MAKKKGGGGERKKIKKRGTADEWKEGGGREAQATDNQIDTLPGPFSLPRRHFSASSVPFMFSSSEGEGEKKKERERRLRKRGGEGERKGRTDTPYRPRSLNVLNCLLLALAIAYPDEGSPIPIQGRKKKGTERWKERKKEKRGFGCLQNAESSLPSYPSSFSSFGR